MQTSNASSSSPVNAPAIAASAALRMDAAVPSNVSQQPIAVPTPTTLSITLAQPTPANIPLYENVSVWVGIATFLGVCISLWAAAKRSQKELDASERRMRIELDQAATQASLEREQTREQAALDRRHDAEEAHNERIATARRLVYLDAIGELVKAQIFLGGLAKQDLTKLDVGAGLGGLLTATARMSILGDIATVAKSRALISLINQILFKGLGNVMPLTKFKSSIELHGKRYAATQFEIERILSAMTNHNETLKDDRQGFDALQRSFEFHQETAKKHTAKITEAQLALAEGEKKYAFTLMEDMKVAANRLDELACAIREELGLEASLEDFQTMTTTMQKDMAAATEHLLAQINAMNAEAAAVK